MNRNRRFEAATGKPRNIALVCLVAVGMSGWTVQAAVADLLPQDQPGVAPALEPKAQRQADALSWFVTGLFAEESDGPEKAMESYRKALELDPANTNLAIRLAYENLRRGETAQAISVLKDTIKAAPKEVTPLLALSTIYLRHLQKPDLALKYAQSAVEVAPRTFAPYAALFEIYQAQGQNTRAEGVIDRAERSKSEDPAFWLSLAELSGRKVLRDTSASLTPEELARLNRYLDKAQETGADQADILSRGGDLYLLTRQIDKAVAAFKAVVAIKPSYPGVKEKLAGCYLETGQSEEAVATIEEIVKSNPLNVKAYDQLFLLYLRMENFSKALAAAEQGLLLSPGDAVRYDQVISLNLDQRKSDKALEYSREALKRFPRTARFSFLEALALSESKQHEEAMKVFERTIVEAGNSNPDLLNGDFYYCYGVAAEQGKQYVKAAELFRKSLSLDPTNANCYNYLGYMWVDRNENLDEAGQLIRRALEIEPNNGAYLDSLGWFYYRKGQFEEALTELLRASENLPEPDAVVYDHIGDTYEKLGKKTEAVLYWQKALQLDAENKDLVEKLDKAAEKVVRQPSPVASPTSQTPVP